MKRLFSPLKEWLANQLNYFELQKSYRQSERLEEELKDEEDQNIRKNILGELDKYYEVQAELQSRILIYEMMHERQAI